jgi:hypothetical protein
MAISLAVKIWGDSTPLLTELEKVKKQLNLVSKELTKMGSQLTQALTLPIIAFGAVAVKEFGEAEKASVTLSAALTANGKNAELLSSQYHAFAEELSKLTTVSRDSAIGLLALAENMKAPDAKKAAQDAIGLSQAYGIDMTRAMKIAIQAQEGQYTLLGRMVPAIKNLKDPTQQAALAQKIMGDAFQVAEAQAKAGLGPLEQMKNTIAELSESFGKIIVTGLTPMINGMKSFATWMDSLSETTKKWILGILAVVAAIGPMLFIIGKIPAILSIMINGFTMLIGVMKNMIMFLAANPWILLAAAIIAVGTALYLHVTRLTAAEAATKALNDTNAKAIEAVASEKQNIESLIKTVESETASKENKLKALKELQDISPKYFGNLTLEKVATEALSVANKKYTDQIDLEKKSIDGLISIAKNEKDSKDKRLDAINKLNSAEPKYFGNLNIEKNLTNDLTVASMGYSNQINSEKQLIENLSKTARDETKTKDERLQAIKKLNEISPEYYGNITLEKVETEKATQATKLYCDALLAKARVEIATTEIAKLMAENDKIAAGVSDAGSLDFWQKLKAGVLSSAGGVMNFVGAMSAAQSSLQNTSEVLKNNNTQIDVYNKIIAENIDKIDKSGKSHATATAELGKELDAYKRLQKEVTDLQEKYNAELATSAKIIEGLSNEKKNVESLIEKIKDENTTKEDKLKAIKALQEISPKYFSGLTLETAGSELLTTATKNFTAACDGEISAKGANLEATGKLLITRKQDLDNIGRLIENEKNYIKTLEDESAIKKMASPEQREEPRMATGDNSAKTHKELIETLAKEQIAYKDLEKEVSGLQSQYNTEVATKNINSEATGKLLTQKKDELNNLERFIGDMKIEIGLMEQEVNLKKENKEEIKTVTPGMVFTPPAAKISPQKVDPNAGIKQAQTLGSVIDKVQSKLIDLTGSLGPLASSFGKTFSAIGTLIQGVASKFVDGWNSAVQEVGAVISSVVGVIGSIIDTSFANREKTMSDYYSNEKDAINNSTMSEKQKSEALTKIGKEEQKERKKLMREQAKDQKEISLVQAIIATALGIVTALANPGGVAGIILAALVGVMGAIEIAEIASQPLPSLAEGGLAFAPTMAMVGDNPNATTDPEVIAPFSKLKSLFQGNQQTIKLEGVLKGSDIYLSNERGGVQVQRIRGY